MTRATSSARIVNASLVASAPAALTGSDRRRAERRLARRQARNPLRRARLGCCGRWVLDAGAVVGDWLWCEGDDDLGRIVEVAE